jgi:hypothetical protein
LNASKSTPTVSKSRSRSTTGHPATHKRMGVGPHTKTTLHHIQALKQKHGIDYCSHASYRFVEG